MTINRMLRVDELVRREIGTICEERIVAELDALLTITRVKTAPDLRNAIVFVSVMGNEAQKQTALKVLLAHRVEIQAEVGRRVQLRYTPVLHFRLDETLAAADHVLALIDGLKLPDTEGGGAGQDAAPESDEPAPEKP